MPAKITHKILTGMIKTLRDRKAQPLPLPVFGGDHYIVSCTPDEAVEVIEIMRTGRPLPLLIKVVRG